MNHKYRNGLLVIASVSCLFAACSSEPDDQTENNQTTVMIVPMDMGTDTPDEGTTPEPDASPDEPDAAPEEDASMTETDMGMDEPDIPTVGEDLGTPNSSSGCDVARELTEAWPLNDKTSTGSFTATDDGGTWTVTFDASAGGLQGSAQNPFLYVDLDGAAKVDITDPVAIRDDSSWEIAFRRTAVFINGGDGGPGSVEIARLTGTSFDAVTSADIPADNRFVTEASVDADCQVIAPPSGFGTVLSVFEQLNPDTTSGSWYNYGGGVSAYPDHVYILRGTDMQKTFKFSFDGWTSGVYEVRWAEL
ncbi:MAG: HmuY family protein [Myxococcota bacterium]|nr:HmuY family protein [Myxococcota bacterium]